MSQRSPQDDFRPVNGLLGASPRLGPFPAEQVFPWMVISFAFYFLSNGIFQLPWLWTGLLIVWGDATWWILTGSKPWRFLSKFTSVPSFARGQVRYQSLLQHVEERQIASNHRASKRSLKSRRKSK